MPRKLSQMTWQDVQKEMSIAGRPEKIAQLGKEIMELVEKKCDHTNKAELINVEFALQRVLAEVRLYQRMYDKKHR